MKYISTRGNTAPVESAAAIRQGMVPGGGLFVPEAFPQAQMEQWEQLSYQELAVEIFALFLTDFSREELQRFVTAAYSRDRFDSDEVVPLKDLNSALSVMELWHGPTAAFKDVALQLLPHLLTASLKKEGHGRDAVILVATSGDTGKAALEGFKDIDGTHIIVFYPHNGVSAVQERQMVTTGGSNTAVAAVQGNFDDCQTMVKQIFADDEFTGRLWENGLEFSSANSINWGRLAPQIVYYFHAYFDQVRKGRIRNGDPLNFCVPTGNFGNILAGYYAKRMGLPVNRLICASNRNKVLTDFFTEGLYDRKREFYRTASPSMDILISSNLERYLFEMAGRDAEQVRSWYAQLEETGRFQISEQIQKEMDTLFHAGFADEQETAGEIKAVFEKYNYLMDTHTAVGMKVYREYVLKSGDRTPTVLDSTASPFKFSRAVFEALTGEDTGVRDEFVLLDELARLSGVPVHRALQGLQQLEAVEPEVIDSSDGRRLLAGLLLPG